MVAGDRKWPSSNVLFDCTALYFTAHLYYNIINFIFYTCTAPHCTILSCTVLHCTALHWTALYYTSLHYLTIHYTTQHYTKIHYIIIQNSVLSFTGHSGQCDMTYSELPSWCPLELSEGDRVIFIVRGGSKIYDKNSLGLLGWAIHLKPQNLSYLNSQLVEVVVFVCLLVFFFYCVHGLKCLGKIMA